jgi:transcriptional regulator with XRE-family HTH domain
MNQNGSPMPGEIKQLLEAIEAYCDKHRITKAHFGRLLGIERQQLNDYFSGRKEPSGSRVLQIQDQLKRKPTKETKKPRKRKPKAKKPK